ncbi:MAG: hypothetical protein ABI871_07565 [Chthoniobacterales bacterium]
MRRALAQCAPITDKPSVDRATRSAVQRTRQGKRAPEFALQEGFDRAVALLVQTIPVAPEVAEWFANENLVPVAKRSWRSFAFNPAVLAVAFAVAVITGIFGYRVHEHMRDFPDAANARKLLTVASSTRSVLLDPVKTDAGALGDFFFMKHQLDHYDVPPKFASFRTLGCRVFDDDEVRRVAQIWVTEKHMQFFLFPAEKNPKDGRVQNFSGWKFVEQEGWTGAVKQENGICFMVAVSGTEGDLAPYLKKAER